MKPENRPEGQEPEESMGDERFRGIYDILENQGISDKEIAEFVKKFNEGGLGAVRVKRAQRQEKEEFLAEQKKEQKELEKRVHDMSDKELEMYSEKYYGELHKEQMEHSDYTKWWHDPFSEELWRRKRDKREIEKLKSQIPDEKQETSIDATLLESKAKSKEVLKKRWWQFWK